MTTVLTDDLELTLRLDAPLLHPSGIVLLDVGEKLTNDTKHLLKEEEINEVICINKGDSVDEYKFEAQHREIEASSLERGRTMSRSIYGKEGELLLNAGSKITGALCSKLEDEGIEFVYIKILPANEIIEKIKRFNLRNDELKFEAHLITPKEKRTTTIKEETSISGEDLAKRSIDSLAEEIGFDVPPPKQGEGLIDNVVRQDLMQGRSMELKLSVVDKYEEAQEQATDLINQFSSSKAIDQKLLSSMADSCINTILEDRDLLLGTLENGEQKNYLADHSVRKLVVASSIGLSLGYSKQQIFDLAYGAMLDDVGMVRVPANLWMKKERLTAIEFRAVQKHTMYGCDMLQKITRLPMTTPFVVYQSHERENGTGYPKRRVGHFIHDYAKIIAIADMYTAFTADRPNRERKKPYQAMESLVLLSSKGFISQPMVRAMLNIVGLFPVGSWVELKDGRIACVVAAVEGAFTKPIVVVTFEKGKRLTDPWRWDLSKEDDVQILRAIKGDEHLDANAKDGVLANF